jgi:Fe2+ transport system protein FeoA
LLFLSYFDKLKLRHSEKVKTMLLSSGQKGTFYRIKSLQGEDQVKRFFAHMSLHKEDVLEVVNDISGHIIVYLKGSRYAMEKEVAKLIEVEAI